MPYYDEYRAKACVTRAPFKSVAPVKETSYARTFRTGPSPLSLTSQEVADKTADPYAYFLDSISRKAYQARLSERGLPAVGVPDRGHTATLKKHVVVSNRASVTRLLVGSADLQYNNVLVTPYTNVAGHLGAVHNGSFGAFPTNLPTGLEAFAQTAYKNRAPTAVMFNAAQFLGELREGLPRLGGQSFFKGQTYRSSEFYDRSGQNGIRNALKGKSKFYGGLGSEYLNVQFGWNPFVADIKNFATALAAATQMLAQQGERVHRTYTLPPVTALESLSLQNVGTVFEAGIGSGVLSPSAEIAYKAMHSVPSSNWTGIMPFNMNGTLSKTRTLKRRFVGEFSSFFPLGFDPSSYLDRANQLISLEITPSVMWELTPWSWLVDWFFKIQDSIDANLLAADDLLVMHYGYATEEMVYTTLWDYNVVRSSIPPKTLYRGLPYNGSTIVQDKWIRRIRANPFGFTSGGPEALSGAQLAILGALGLTKL